MLANTLASLNWEKLDYRAPQYFFVKKELELQTKYKQGFAINTLFQANSSGVTTHRDNLVIDFDEDVLSKRIEDLFNPAISDNEIRLKYELKNNRDWNLSETRLKNKFQQSALTKITYRPFDNRYIYYDSSVIDFDRKNIMQHFLSGDNLGIAFGRQTKNKDINHFHITKNIIEKKYAESSTQCYCAPLYLYPDSKSQQNLDKNSKRKPNLNHKIVEQITAGFGVSFVDEKEAITNTFAPIDLLDYIYAVLHSPTYRETYKEFLKIDFPRIPYPKDSKTFWHLVQLGGQLRQIHLLESSVVEDYITCYPKDGDNIVTRRIIQKDWEFYDTGKQLGRLWINDNQYFDHIPLIAWESRVGGYQPAQKWLKDRTGRKLSYEDILHYQKIIKALAETDRLMKEIDNISIE